MSFTLKKTPRVSIQTGTPINQSQRDPSTQVLARKIDLAGTYDLRTITDSSAVLAAGRWQFAIAPGGPNYASAFSGSGSYYRNPHPEGWNEAMIFSTGGSIRFTLANATSTLHGLVKDGVDLVVGAPVFLEPVEIDELRRVTENYVAVSDVHGQYKFPGVLPGRYRLLSTFEYQMPDGKTMTAAKAIDVQVDRRSDVTRDLDLYVIR